MVGDNMDKFNIDLPELTSVTPRASGTMYWSSGASFSMIVDWSTSPNVSGGYTTVSVTMRMENASVSGTCRSGSHITINGNQSSFANKTLSYGGNGSNFTLHSHSVNVYHTNAVNVSISGAWAWNGYIWISGVYSGNFNTVSGSGTVSCAAILTPPGAPTWCTHTGNFDNGYKTSVNWGGASGTIDRYIVQIRFWNRDTGYGAWGSLGQTNSSTTNFEIGHGGVANDGLQVRVFAQNSAGDSSAKEGDLILHEGIKYYNGGWNISKTKVWNGSSWTKGYVRVWNGSAWVRP
nr:MAG TPA: hypothetical protein [Caudoviricetes sp.]